MSQWSPPLRPGVVTFLGALFLVFGLYFLFQFISYEETNRLKTVPGALARLLLVVLCLGFGVNFLLIGFGIYL